MHQSGGMMDILPESPAAQAGSQLAGFFGNVAFYPDDAVAFDMQPQGASTATVEGGCGSDDFDAFFWVGAT
jgi:hypothetical protein